MADISILICLTASWYVQVIIVNGGLFFCSEGIQKEGRFVLNSSVD